MTKFFLFAFAISSIVASVVQGAAVPAELEEAATKARTVCLEETGATVEMLENAAKGDFAEDEKLKCYFKCVLEKFTLIEEDKINIDAMLELAPPSIKEAATKTLGNCHDPTGADMCEKAWNFNKCLQEHSPEAYFVV